MSTQYEAPAITELGDFTEETGASWIADSFERCYFLFSWQSGGC
jgi:hypothetical protein